MRHIYKHIIIGFILASFTFSPSAFAAPGKLSKSDKELKNVIKVIKKSKKGVKMSDMVESVKPLLRKRVYRTIARDTLPFWDKKFSKVNIGRDYARITYNGRTLFMRYVDRGPVAFMVNNKPLLWKDFMTYEKARDRIYEIITGRPMKKVSFLEKFMSYFSKTAYAVTEESCADRGRSFSSSSRCGGCLPGYNLDENSTDDDFQNNDTRCYAPPPDTDDEPARPIPPDTADQGDGDDDDKMLGGLFENLDWLPLAAAGAFIGFVIIKILSSMFNKNKSDSDTEDQADVEPLPVDPEPADPEPPLAGWTPEGSCPTPGARGQDRGLATADYPPECRQSGCSSGTCEGSGTGTSIDGDSGNSQQQAPMGY